MSVSSRGFTLIEFIVIGAIIGTLIGLFTRPAWNMAGNEPMRSWTLYTVQHDGHWWVLGTTGNGCIHHPDCPCRKGKIEAEQ